LKEAKKENKMKKFIVLVVLVAIVFAFIPALKVNAVSEVNVKVTPTDRGAYGEYTITFTISKELKIAYDSIFLQFPQESTIPCTSCAYAHCTGCFKINGVNAAGAGPIENNNKAMYLRIPTNIPAGSKVEVVISQSAGFQNPSVPGKYTLKIWTSQETEKVTSNEFEITSTKIENLKITTDPEFTNAKSKVVLTFTTGRLGNLQNGKFIYIRLPEEFTLPQVVRKEFITVNTENPTEAKIDGKTLSLKIASSITNYRDVTINIYSSFGVINPAKKGTYIFTVWTDSEVDPVTATIEIKEKDFVRTLIQTSPIEPDGVSGFFKSPVTVTLLGETNTQENIQTFYKVDSGDFKLYEAPFSISESTHTVSYYSKTNYITEDLQTKTFKIDLTPPSIAFNFEETTYTAESTFVISGKMSEPSTLYINGIMVDVKSDLSFAKEFPLENGGNTFTLRATDVAGNSTIRQVTVVLDPTTPVLTVESPTNWQQFEGKGVLVKGSVYPENCNVYVNGEKIPLGEKGNFDFTYTPETTNTLLSINITAVYSLTGKSAEQKIILTYEPKATEIVLTVGKKEILVKGKVNLIDVAPFIDKVSGRTLVPVRFISEFLGFEVVWDAQAKTVTIKDSSKTIILTIGNKTILINGKAYKIDVTPLIKDSRTFVPLRFISEAFGYQVNWDAKTQTVTISQ
jgi:hypothetical protein